MRTETYTPKLLSRPRITGGLSQQRVDAIRPAPTVFAWPQMLWKIMLRENDPDTDNFGG